jgi:hypothetical protein
MILSPLRQAAAAAALAATAITCTACTLLQPPSRAPARPRPAATRAPHPAATPTPGLAALLPVSPAQLQAAAALAARFAAAYDTCHPGQQPSAWLAQLRPMTAPQLYGALAQTAATPALWPCHQPQAVQATAGQIRDLTPASVIFTVHVRQAQPAGPATATGDLAVTLVRSGSGWAVYDIEPAAYGNTG